MTGSTFPSAFLRTSAAKFLPLALLVGTAARAQDPAAGRDLGPTTGGPAGVVVPADGVVPSGAVPADDPERRRATAELIDARRAYADLLTSVLTSEELAAQVRRISADVQIRRAESDLDRSRAALRAAEASGRAGTPEAGRIAARAAAAETELNRLRAAGPDAAAGDTLDTARDVLVTRLRAAMDAETDRLVVTLDAREMDRQARRLRRLVTAARIADGLRAAAQSRRSAGGPTAGPFAAEEVVPAGGPNPAPSPVVPAGGDLGAPSAAPPAGGDLGAPSSTPPADRLGPPPSAAPR